MSIERLTDIQLATMNIAISLGLPVRRGKEGFETVSHLFDEEGYLLNPTFSKAFAFEINRRVTEGG